MVGEPVRESVEEAWVRLRRHLDRADAFWLGFVFTGDPTASDVLAERAAWNRRARALPFLRFHPTQPSELATIVDQLETEAPGPEGCTWVDAVHVGDDLLRGGSWSAEWITLLQQLNHRRDTLRRRLGGLVLVAPPVTKPDAIRFSSDLWSVRDFLSELLPLTQSVASDDRPLDRIDVAPPVFATRRPPVSLTPQRGHEAAQQEVIRLLAAGDEEISGPLRDRVDRAIAEAVAREDGDAADGLRLRRGFLRLDVDPAGARDDLEAVAAGDGEPGFRLQAMQGLFGLAWRAQAMDVAEDIARLEVGLAQRLADQLATPEALRDLSISLDNLGTVHRARGDWANAETTYQRSLELRERLADQLATPEALRDLTVSLNNLGTVHEARGDWANAETTYQRSLELAENASPTNSPPPKPSATSPSA